MVQSTFNRSICHLQHLRDSFAQQSGLPFADIFPENIDELLGPTTESIYTPAITLAMFLSQVLDSDGSCQQAVSRLQVWRAATKQPACSENTGAYCKARQRLHEETLRSLTLHCGQTLSQRTRTTDWMWKGRQVRVVDGSTVSAADTPDNQKEYPQPDGQKPGLGFPILRLVILFCLASGAVLKAAYSPYQGAGTGEISLLRQVWDALEAGDVLVGDRIYCSYMEMALLQSKGIDVVFRKHQSRDRDDFPPETWWGRPDRRVVWVKPARPKWMDDMTYQSLPELLTLREVRVTVNRPGFRVKQFEIITSILDAAAVSSADLGELYRQRWQAELYIRALKESLGMDRLRCKTPEMVRKELWVHLLGYNLIRGAMAQAASLCGETPRRLSFKGAVQSVQLFGLVLSVGDVKTRYERMRRLWWAIGNIKIPDRPDRVEPRAIKRRKRNYPLLTEPRKLARKRLFRKHPGIRK